MILRVLETLADPAAAPEGVQQRGPDMADVLRQFEPLLRTIAAIAIGDTTRRGEVEGMLAELEKKGWKLTAAAQRIWAGERDLAALTADLDAQDTALVGRVLDILAHTSAQTAPLTKERPAPDASAEAGADAAAQLVAVVVQAVRGDRTARQTVAPIIERMLADPNAKKLGNALLQLLMGERDAATLTAGLAAPDAALLRAILSQLPPS